MAKLVSVFISSGHRRLISVLVWVATFATVLALVGGYALHKTADAARAQTERGAEQFLHLRTNLLAVFDMMHAQLTAAPCSPAFHDELRRIAYLPDGLNEFLYAPGGKAQCSTRIAAFGEPVDFGAPDIDGHTGRGISLWIDRDLGFLGLAGEKGTFALSDPFVAVIPPHAVDPHPSHWLSMEMVLVAADGSWFHRGGEPGVYQRRLADAGSSVPWSGRVGDIACGPDGVHCVAVEGDLAALMASEKGALALVLVAAALISAYASGRAARLIARHWSFEARFRRHLDAGSIVCAYQPVMRLDSGEIAGCEVLARWRDVDGSVVPPDKFVEIVARSGQTLAFTKMVAERAFEELSRTLPSDIRLQVNFNIFPRDLDSEKLGEAFRAFEGERERFPLALEIVESDALAVDSAQREIEALARHGIQTYIDDFGDGYSSIHRVASLAIHGVKLDRSFAMAPSESLMARMLVHALDMVASSGREIVVEGVETQDRLDLLIQTKRVAYAQGYLISRPLPIERLAEFLANHDAAAALAGGARAEAA